MKSLYFKFAVTTIFIMLFSGLLAFIGANSYYQQKLKPENDEKNTRIAQDIANYASRHADMSMEDYFNHIAGIGYQIMLTDRSGREEYFGAEFRNKELPVDVKEKVLSGSIYHGMADFPKETFVTGFFANEVRNTIGVPLQHSGKEFAIFIRPDVKLLFSEMHVLLAWLMGLSILLSILFVLIGTKFLVQPITELTRATQKLAHGDFAVKLDIERSDEIGELAYSFTHMAEKLDQLDEMRKELISNISHDIQSPLSNIKGYVNLLENPDADTEERKQSLDIINREINRLSGLTKQLLMLASLDSSLNEVRLSQFDVSEQLKEVIKSYQWALQEKELMIGYSLPETKITGDTSLLYAVWDNLMSNAVKYNRPHGSIEITVSERQGEAEIVFQDTGIGISGSELKRIFDRFYRADASRTSSIEGSGLGLSISAAIVRLHNGTIKVESDKDKGTAFIVRIPQM